MINNDNFIIWLEGYMDALESKGVEKIETSIIRNKLKTINLQHFARKLYSQNSEDGITIKLIEMLYDNPENKNYVEFGVEDGMQCNTKVLRENYGWDGLMMDGTYYDTFINLHSEFVTKENICSLFEKYNIPKNINLLSVDIDMNDYWVLKEIITEYTADIIITEYNGHLAATESKTVPYKPENVWDGTNYYGASLLAFNKLLEPAGYTLVCCDPNGVNAFFVKTTLLKERNINIKNAGNVGELFTPMNQSGSGRAKEHPADIENRKYINV